MKTYSERREFAQSATAGEYFAQFDDDGLDEMSDPGSRCGYGDDELDDLERLLNARGLTLTTDDIGLVVRERA